MAADWAYVRKFAQTSYGVSVDFAGNDLAMDTPYGASFPRWKGNTTFGWNWHDIDAALTYRYSGPYTEEIVGNSASYPFLRPIRPQPRVQRLQKLTVYGKINNIL